MRCRFIRHRPFSFEMPLRQTPKMVRYPFGTYLVEKGILLILPCSTNINTSSRSCIGHEYEIIKIHKTKCVGSTSYNSEHIGPLSAGTEQDASEYFQIS